MLVVALLVTSCSGGQAKPPRSTVRTEPDATTTTAAPIDVSVIPEVITVEYLDAVMDELDLLIGRAFRKLVADREPSREFDDLLNAVYDEPALENQRAFYGRVAARNFVNVRDDPGEPTTTVERIIKNEPGCVIVAAQRTFAAFFVDPKPGGAAFLAFVPRADDVDHPNATALSLVFDGGTLDDIEPMDVC